MSALLAASGITKRFEGAPALDGVELTVGGGTIHAVLGENGAGKTTLLNILFGLTRPDAGTVRWRGRDLDLASPAAARATGIGMVHQHFMLVDALTVWENLALAHPETPRFLLDRHRSRRAVRELSERFALGLDPDARVGDLPVGARQRLEIAKALARPVDLLLLDEPTAVLAPAEIDGLFDVLRALADAGTAILFVSHKLREVLRISEEITVLRHGRVTASCRTEEADEPTLTRSIVGDGATGWARSVPKRVARGPAAVPEPEPRLPGGPWLRVRGLSGRRAGRIAVEDLSLEVRAGEVLGITGVDGNGQEELVAMLAGVAPVDAGSVEVRRRDVTHAGVRARREAGLAVVPGDRGGEGLVGDAPVWENLALRDFGAPWARRGPLVSPPRHVARAERRIRERGVVATPYTPARHLSGGNQQKLVLARELEGDPAVIVLLNSTRGLDVGAADSLLRELAGLRDEGRAILFVSTELDEVLSLADRVAVLCGGRLREVPGASREEVGALMLGAGAP